MKRRTPEARRHRNRAYTLNIMALYGVAALLAAGFLWTPANAQKTALSPTETLKQRDKTLQTLAASIHTEEGEAKIRTAIVESFDFEEHSRISLGKYWKERSKAEQQEFIEVMRGWTENRAIKKLLKRAEQTTYDHEEIIGTRATVNTTVLYKGTKTYVDYKMKMMDGRWRIYDMVIDGASVALANRDAFYKKINKTSYEELVQTLKDKTLETS